MDERDIDFKKKNIELEKLQEEFSMNNLSKLI